MLLLKSSGPPSVPEKRDTFYSLVYGWMSLEARARQSFR